MKICHTTFLTGLIVLVAPYVNAEEISPDDTIVVTATRTEVTIADTMIPVTVITRDAIELSGATDLTELLRFEAGIDIGRNGGPGQTSSVFLRGTESNHTLVLVDGVRINPGTIGGAAFEHIAPELIERIEIVKGARSSLFGTDAIGGVINVITRKTDDAYVEASAGAGNFDTRSAYVSGGNRSDQGEFSVTLNTQNTAGFPPRSDSDIERGYDNTSLNLSASRRLGRSSLGVRYWHTEGNVEYLDFFLNPVDQDFEVSVAAVELNSQFSNAGESRLLISHSRDQARQSQVPDFIESARTSLDWQYTQPIGRHTLTGGLYAVNENAQSLSFGTGFNEDTDVRALFVQDQIGFDRHRALVVVRYTDHETFGGQTTWNAEYGFNITDAWTLAAGAGRAFRAPDASDRFGFGGNPTLDPELSQQAQAALRFVPGGRHRIELELYANDIDDLIEFDFSTFTVVNVGRAEIRGAQLGYEYRGDTFTLRSALVRQSAENKTTGERLLRRAEETLTLSYVQNLGAHRLGISVLASGDRVDFGGTPLDSYVVANLSGQFRLGTSWHLHARVENLFDEKYETAANFRMQELSGFVELKYRWQ